jgi:NDP-mannose synthase
LRHFREQAELPGIAWNGGVLMRGLEDVHVALVAGGRGERLTPITDVLPKVLVPLRGRPLLEYTLDAVEQAGVTTVHLMLGRHSDLVEAYVAATRHRRPGLHIRTHVERSPLGTAGPLRLLEDAADQFLVVNGDVLVGPWLRPALLRHLARGADLTVLSVPYSVHIPFGVISSDEHGRVLRLEEKPTLSRPVAAGAYVVGARVLRLIPGSGACAMPDLIELALSAELDVRHHDLGPRDAWGEIGEPGGLLAAQESVRAISAGSR